MANQVKVRYSSQGVGGAVVDELLTASYASPAAAIAGISSGFLTVTPVNASGIGGSADEPQRAINTNAIVEILQA
jgi:hypothetical protein